MSDRAITRFSSIEAIEQMGAGMEEDMRAAMAQLDALRAEPTAAHQ